MFLVTSISVRLGILDHIFHQNVFKKLKLNFQLHKFPKEYRTLEYGNEYGMNKRISVAYTVVLKVV